MCFLVIVIFIPSFEIHVSSDCTGGNLVEKGLYFESSVTFFYLHCEKDSVLMI